MVKTSQERFLSYHCFRSQHIYYNTIAVCSNTNMLKRYLICRTFSKCQPNSNESCLSIRACTYKIHADNQLHKCVCGTVSVQMKILQI